MSNVRIPVGRTVLFREALAPLKERYVKSPTKSRALDDFVHRTVETDSILSAQARHPVIALRYWQEERKLMGDLGSLYRATPVVKTVASDTAEMALSEETMRTMIFDMQKSDRARTYLRFHGRKATQMFAGLWTTGYGLGILALSDPNLSKGMEIGTVLAITTFLGIILKEMYLIRISSSLGQYQQTRQMAGNLIAQE